ncbi:MAG: prolyl hydroxylase family protein [Chitinophagaceae bacterium]
MKSVLVGAIAIYRSAIENPQLLIDLTENDTNTFWRKSTLYGSKPISDFRTSSEMNQFPMEVNKIFNQSFKKAVNHYICRFNASVVLPNNSHFNLLKYQVGEEFKTHYDDSEFTPRRISAVGFLNDNYQGGELYFDSFKFVYEPVAGDIVVFPSIFAYSHASLPVTEGTKYSVVGWWK